MEEYLLLGTVLASLLTVVVHDLFIKPPWTWGLFQIAFWIAGVWAAYVLYTSDGPISVEAIIEAAGLLAFGAILILRALYTLYRMLTAGRAKT